MASDSRRSLELVAIVVPILVAAAGGKMAVDAARLKIYPSASLPSPQELDSLRGYAVRSPAPVPAAPAPAIGAYGLGGPDPFSSVLRSETPRYSTVEAQLPAARSRSAPWIVSTIMITETRRVAVVNGSLASVGSVLPGGARVIGIEPDRVVIAEAGGARREVFVQGGAN